MFQPAALRNAISWGGNGPRLRRGPKGGGRLVFWRIDGTFAIRNSGAIWPKPPCHKPYIGPNSFSVAPSTLVGLTVYSPRTRFWTCRVAGLSVIRRRALTKTGHASLSPCRRIGSPFPSAPIGVLRSW